MTVIYEVCVWDFHTAALRHRGSQPRAASSHSRSVPLLADSGNWSIANGIKALSSPWPPCRAGETSVTRESGVWQIMWGPLLPTRVQLAAHRAIFNLAMDASYARLRNDQIHKRPTRVRDSSMPVLTCIHCPAIVCYSLVSGAFCWRKHQSSECLSRSSSDVRR